MARTTSKISPPSVAQMVTDKLGPQTMRSWSHSKLGDFEKCKHLTWLKHIKRIPEPERPLPPGKTEHANDRGSRVHDALERFVDGSGTSIPIEARHFAPELKRLNEMHTQGIVSLEGEWGMDIDWNPAPWNTAWLRLKLDALAFLTPSEAVAIDYKTGKKFGNEIKHGEQLNLYALCSFLRFPQLEVVHTELWYLDIDELTRNTFTRDQSLRFKRNWDAKGRAITTNDVWPPNPNIHSCKWCPYKGTEHCDVGVA